MDQLSLLPRRHQEFREKAYWDEFFEKRQSKAFEWYGDFASLKKLLYSALEIDSDYPQKVQKQLKHSKRILVIGCGNSELSKQLVDDGFDQVVSIDFSEQVIEEMKIKHPALDWRVMDMTRLALEDQSFDVVLDKGALDALMASDETEIRQDATRMFEEIARVLRVAQRGKYLCVTMAQNFILQHVLDFFMLRQQPKWQTFVQEIPRDARKPFAPFLVTFTRVEDPQDAHRVRFGNTKRFGGASGDVDPMEQQPKAKQWLVHEMEAVQWYTMTQRRLKEISVGRQEVVELADNTNSSVSTPRYTLRLVDVHQQGPNGSCAVFLIPQGKEHEWMFSTEEGAKELAQGAGFSRLILVALGHGHVFQDTKQIQNELNSKILELAPLQMAKHEQIPYLTIPQGLGNRKIISKGKSDVSGEFFIEEVVENGESFRRLVFLTNTNVIQSEVRLVAAASTSTSTSTSVAGTSHTNGLSSKKKKCKKKKKKKTPATGISVGSSTAASPAKNLVVDESYLAFDYHKAMVALLAAAQSAASQSAASQPTRHDSLLVGLGGGCLAKYIHDHFTRVHMTVCELDPSIVDVAHQFFGFETSNQNHVEVMDGIEFVAKQASQAQGRGLYDSMVIDVDAKEQNNQGMSCPPVAFIEPDFLQNVAKCLKSDGLLLVNVSCRSSDLYQQIISRLKTAFGTTTVLALAPSDQDVNRVVVVQKTDSKSMTLLEISQALIKTNTKVKPGILRSDKQLDVTVLELLEELCIVK